MKAERIFRAIGLIDDSFLDIADSTPARKPVNTAWIKWVSIAACLALVFGLSRSFFRMGAKSTDSSNDVNTSGSSVLPSSSDGATGNMNDTTAGVFPEADTESAAVMVNGRLYRWEDTDTLPANAELYGEIVHVDRAAPENDCELTADFAVEGEIYTVEGNDSAVYLVVTTDWLHEAVVRFVLK